MVELSFMISTTITLIICNIHLSLMIRAGKCGKDGLYFRDAYSFVFCSNGNSYIQPCAPGSKNSGYGHFRFAML